MRQSQIYASIAIGQAPRLLSLLDREPRSPSYGSFDREHWAWKFRDFPRGMLQSAVYPLALLWRHPLPGNPYFRNPRLLEWIFAAVEQTLSRQHAKGAFIAVTPDEQEAGPTLGVLHGLAEAFRLLGSEVPRRLQERFLEGLRRGCDFALSFDELETHGFVSNHWGLFANVFLDAQELLGDARYRRAADEAVERILREQSPDGWYNEYGGPDPGYESLGIFHLAQVWRRTGEERLRDSLRRSIDFYSHCVHPDGSVGGVYASRQTSLYFPAGFEILAREIPLAGAVAGFLAARLDRGNVVTPAVADAENLTPFAYTYLEAALGPVASPGPAVRLPCETLDGLRHFEHSGISVAGTGRYYAVVNLRKGGTCRIFDKHAEKLAYEDAGYVVRAGRRLWVSQRLGAAERVPGEAPGEVASEGRLVAFHPLLPTPANYVLLRLLSFTLFRIPALARWFRWRIVARLMGAARPGPLGLRRRMHFSADAISFRDRLGTRRPMKIEEVELPRSLTAIHMGSAKYFHPAELDAPPQAPVSGMAAELRQKGWAECEFTLEFDDNGVALVTGATTRADESTRPEVLTKA